MIARKFSLLRQLAWATTLATGFAALWGMLVAWLGTSIQNALPAGNPAVFERLQVRSDGTLLIQGFPQDGVSEVTYRDLKGVEQRAPDRDDLLSAVSLFHAQNPPGFFSPRPGWSERLTAFVNEREPTVNWFFVHDGEPDGAGYFAGYDRTSKRRVGFIGMSGFRKDPVPPAEWIPVRGNPISSAPSSIYSGHQWVLRPEGGDVPPRLVYLPSGSQLRQADLAAHTVTTVFEAPEPIESVGIPMLAYWSNGHSSTEQPILVRTTQQIHELDQQHHVVKVFTLPADVDRRNYVEWHEIKTGQVIAIVGPLWSTGGRDNVMRQMVYRIKGDGAIEDQFPVDLQTGSTAPNKQVQALWLALGLPVPAIVSAIGLVVVIATDHPQGYAAAVAVLLKDSGLSIIAVLALSIVLAILAHRRSRAFGLSGASKSVGRCLCSFSACRLTWAFDCIVVGRSGSPVRVATLRLPATV